jgi:PilZ domain
VIFVAGEGERGCMTHEEKRKHQRLESLNISYVSLDEDQRAVKQGMGRTLNISESGILLETRFPISAEQTLMLSIGLEERVVDVKGRLIHIRSTEQENYEVGIEFLEPDERVLDAIRLFLRSMREQGR